MSASAIIPCMASSAHVRFRGAGRFSMVLMERRKLTVYATWTQLTVYATTLDLSSQRERRKLTVYATALDLSSQRERRKLTVYATLARDPYYTWPLCIAICWSRSRSKLAGPPP